MKLSFLGLNLSVSRQQHEEMSLSLQDVKCANDEVLSYIKSLSMGEVTERINSVTCSVEQGVDRIKEILSDKGIVIIPDFLPEGSLCGVKQGLDDIRKEISAFVSEGQPAKESDSVLFQQGATKLSGYSALSGYGKSVVQIRHGQDQGMIDIFNVDKWKGSIGDTLRPYFESKLIADVMNVGDFCPEARNLNLYLNTGVTSTRGFHVDSYSKQLKGFMYLEDCLSLEDGPYTYVKESHLESSLRKINKQVSSVLPNKTETPFVSLQKIVPVLAKKGALVISDQGGSHRGFPQASGHQRAVAVMNFR